jgi:hypothetical protein
MFTFSGTAFVRLTNCDLHLVIASRWIRVTFAQELFCHVSMAFRLKTVLSGCDYIDKVIHERRFVTSIFKKHCQNIARVIFLPSPLRPTIFVITLKARFMVGASNALHLLSLSHGMARSLGKVNAFRKKPCPELISICLLQSCVF